MSETDSIDLIKLDVNAYISEINEKRKKFQNEVIFGSQVCIINYILEQIQLNTLRQLIESVEKEFIEIGNDYVRLEKLIISGIRRCDRMIGREDNFYFIDFKNF